MQYAISPSAQRAFSLVELSIVLVILGLLTSGILTGQSLIRAAEMRAIITERENLETAVMSFKGKYLAMPGDMKNAEQFWQTDPDGCPTHTNRVAKQQTCNGNGNGRIEVTDGEIFRAWQHLANAELIEGSYTGVQGTGWVIDHDIGINSPVSKFTNAGWGIQHQDAWDGGGDVNWFPTNNSHILFFGADMAPERSLAPVAKAEEAWNLDTKMDDGNPATGKVRGWKRGGNVNPVCTTSDDAATAQYDVMEQSTACSFYFGMGV